VLIEITEESLFIDDHPAIQFLADFRGILL
jgi:hypothetical protein